jgi:hypothetical protein
MHYLSFALKVAIVVAIIWGSALYAGPPVALAIAEQARIGWEVGMVYVQDAARDAVDARRAARQQQGAAR